MILFDYANEMRRHAARCPLLADCQAPCTRAVYRTVQYGAAGLALGLP